MRSECKQCGRGIRELGLCATCIVGSWSPEQRFEVNHLIGVATRRGDDWNFEPPWFTGTRGPQFPPRD